MLALDIEKPAAGGRMIARAQGQIVLVDGAIPGERVETRIERVQKGVAFGRVVAIHTVSPDRRDWTDRLCGGCLYGDIRYDRQRALKSELIADALSRIGRLSWPSPIPVRPSPEAGYRLRARLHYRDRRLGFFREGSHQLCPIAETRQLGAQAVTALEAVEAILADSNMPVPAELECSENIDGTERALHLELAGTPDEQRLRAIGELAGVTGVTVGQPAVGSREHALVLAGSPFVSDRLASEGAPVVLRRHVLSFFQGNRFLLNDLVTHVINQVKVGSTLFDLYAGVGLFSVAAAVRRQASVTAVEGDQSAAADLSDNAGSQQSSIRVLHEPVETFVSRREKAPDTLVVDPPRTGMSTPALTGALAFSTASIVYVSCDVATLARDARRIVESGYFLDRLEAFDLFPNTPHVETVAVFTRR